MSDVWRDDDYLLHLASLPANRQALVKGYAKVYAEMTRTRNKLKHLGRKLTDHEVRVADAMASEEVMHELREK